MIYEYSYNGLIVHTGDIICTRDGVEGSLFGEFWRLFGRLVPGEIDHCVVYIGPGGNCVESALKGVVRYEMPGYQWDSVSLAKERLFVDTLVGVAYPLENRGLSLAEELKIREGVASFCLHQAEERKPYNINFINPDTDRAFYCSQLVYKAYLAQGINLNTNLGVPAGSVLDRFVFPEEIWNSSFHRRVGDPSELEENMEQLGFQDKRFHSPDSVSFNQDTGLLLLHLDKKAFHYLDQQVVHKGKIFDPKAELHITILSQGASEIVLDSIRRKRIRLSQIQQWIDETDWSYRKEQHLYHVQKASGVESIIQFVEVPGIKSFYDRLNRLLQVNLELPPTHVTLYTLGDPVGIGLPTQEVFDQMVTGEISPGELEIKGPTFQEPG